MFSGFSALIIIPNENQSLGIISLLVVAYFVSVSEITAIFTESIFTAFISFRESF